jgi:hypothetical protein
LLQLSGREMVDTKTIVKTRCDGCRMMLLVFVVVVVVVVVVIVIVIVCLLLLAIVSSGLQI